MLIIVLSCWFWLGQGQNHAADNQSPASAQVQSSPSISSSTPAQNPLQAGNEGQQYQGNSASWSDPLIFLQLLLFIAVAIQAGVYVWQAILMRRTLAVLQGQASTMGQQASLTGQQAKLTALSLELQITTQSLQMKDMLLQRLTQEEQLQTMREQSNSMATSVIAMETQATVMQGQLDAMQSQEKAMRESLDETRKAVRYSEAAYVAITDASLIQFGGNKITICRMFYANNGNTPAYNVRVYGHMNLWDRPLIPKDHEKLKEIGPAESSQHIMAPNGVRDHVISPNTPLPASSLQLIQNGSHRFYIWGIITYEDIFGRERWTTFCHMQVGGGTVLVGCGSNNDADR